MPLFLPLLPSPQADPTHRPFCTRGTYIRYLRARGWKVDRAAKVGHWESRTLGDKELYLFKPTDRSRSEPTDRS